MSAAEGARSRVTVIFPFQIEWGACWLVITGNVVMFLTIYGFFLAFDNEDGFEYSSWGIGY